MPPSTISSINKLPIDKKREIYTRFIPNALLERFNISPEFTDQDGNDLLTIRGSPGKSSVEVELRHQVDFPDPILYGHLTDTLNGQIHVLLYVLNDPHSTRFDVDKLEDGRKTIFGTRHRNIEAEIAAMNAGLAPGQVRSGLRLLSKSILSFEEFITSLNHDVYFVEPLYYHNAVVFEKYGFAYQKGRKLMERIQSGFLPGGKVICRLDGSSPFRMPEYANSIRLRSWAIHDLILDEPYTDVTMYKYVGKSAGMNTCTDCDW